MTELIRVETGETKNDGIARLRAQYPNATLSLTELRDASGVELEPDQPNDPPLTGNLYRVRATFGGNSSVSYGVVRYRHPDDSLREYAPVP